MQSRARTLLAILTFGFIVVSTYSVYQIYFFSDPRYAIADESDPERNDQSTPRSFILPATPAVAIEQEKRAAELRSGLSTEKCISKLQDLGYQIDDMDTSFNATYIKAIIEFQKSNGMLITGSADSHTRAKLGC